MSARLFHFYVHLCAGFLMEKIHVSGYLIDIVKRPAHLKAPRVKKGKIRLLSVRGWTGYPVFSRIFLLEKQLFWFIWWISTFLPRYSFTCIINSKPRFAHISELTFFEPDRTWTENMKTNFRRPDIWPNLISGPPLLPSLLGTHRLR